MAVSTICRRCRQRIEADTEDDLVDQVQAHALDHGGAHGRHVPSRERILEHIRQDSAE
jgi:predicted small metal-binding protein